MTYLIFTTGLLLGFVVSNFIALWMIARAKRDTKEYEERLFKYHEERNEH